MPKIFLTKNGYVTGSGNLNNPARIILRSKDNTDSSRPRRLNIGNNLGNYKIPNFSDDRTVKFGDVVQDDFNLDANNLNQFTKSVNNKKWVVGNRDIVIRKEDMASLSSETKHDPFPGAVVLVGGFSRWIRSKEKVKNASITFKVICGGYKFSDPRSINLEPSLSSDQTLLLQVSNDGINWNNVELESKNISNPNVKIINKGLDPTSPLTTAQNINILPINLDGTRVPEYTVKVDSAQLTSAVSDKKESFYIRIIQETIPGNSNTNQWAIKSIKIISRDQEIQYPTGLPTQQQSFASSGIANPSYLQENFQINNSIASSHSTQVFLENKTLNPNTTPFNDNSYVIDESDQFYTQGTLNRVYPGFATPVASKRKIEVDLTPSEPIEFGNVTPIGSLDVGDGGSASGTIDTSEDGQQLMVYWNSVLKKWEKRGRPLNFNNTSSPTGLTAVGFLSQSCLGFAGITYILTGSPSSSDLSESKLLSRDFYSGLNKPTDACGFPFSGQYHATGSQYLTARDLGINKPFLLEKCVLDTKFNMRVSTNSDGYRGKIYYGGDDSPPTSKLVTSAGAPKIFAPTFFILRQYKDAFNKKVDIGYTAASTTPNNLSFNVKIPDFYYLNSGSDVATYVDDSRELITYGQFLYYVSQSSNSIGATLPISPKDFFDGGLTADINLVRDEDGDEATLDVAKSAYIFSESVRIPFPVRNCAAYPNRFALQVYDQSQGHSTPQSSIRGALFGKSVGSRSESTLKYPRSLVNGVGPINTGDSIVIPDPRIPNTAEAFTSTLAKSNTLVKDSPYVLHPDDKLIFGWQFPPNSFAAQNNPGINNEGFRSAMELLGKSRLYLFGSEVANNVEKLTSLNQENNSDAIFEIIGDDPVTDKFELGIAGELTGSVFDSFPYDKSARGFVYGRAIIPDEDDVNVVDINEQKEWIQTKDPLIRVGSVNISLISNANNNGLSGGRTYLGAINTNLNLCDLSRTFVDSRNVNLNDGNTFATVADLFAPVARPGYGSMQNILADDVNGVKPKRLGGFPKYYFTGKRYGHYSDLMRQGFDGTFVDNPSTLDDNVFTESPIKIIFMESSYDATTGYRNFSSVSPNQIDGTSEEEFQSSNLSLYATSSVGFDDSGTAGTSNPAITNRTYSPNFVSIAP